MKKIKRIAALVLVTLMLISAIPVFTSCGADEAEVLKAFKELYAKSVEINEIIFGQGLPHEEAYDYQGYGKISDSSPYKSENQLRAAVLEVYSKDYYNSSLKYALFGTDASSGSNTKIGARYRQDKQGRLEVFVDYEGYSNLVGECLIDKAEVTSTWPDVIVTVPVEIDGVLQKKKHDVYMVQEDDGSWRYDTISQMGTATKDEDTVKAACKQLYAASESINDIIWGAGLPYDGEYNVAELTDPYYVPVSANSPYKTKAELEKAILDIYSKDYFEDFIKYDIYGNSAVPTDYARYKEENGVLYVNVCDDGDYNGKALGYGCDIDKATVSELSGTEAKLIAKYTVNGEKLEKTFMMTYENGAWKLNNFSYYTYVK